jgi:hypothetical protein
LYNLKTDEKEQFNVAATMPLVVKELTELLQKQIQSGRSSEGRDQ